MQQCAACGSQLKDGARFCTVCGARVELEAVPAGPPAEVANLAPPPPAAGYAAAAAPVPAAAPKRSRGMVVAIAVLLVGALTLCGASIGFGLWRAGVIGGKGGASASTAKKGGSDGAASGGGAGPSASENPTGMPEGGTASGGTAGGDAPDGPPSTPPVDITSMAQLAASSVLKASSKADYDAGNLVDGDYETCWAEGVGGYGAGQSATFRFPREVWIAEVHVIPGYLKYDASKGVDRWYSNGRVKSAKLRFSDGSASKVFALDGDRKDWQSLILDEPVKTSYVTFEIVAAYPAGSGTSSDAADTSVSEMTVTGWDE